MFLNIIKWAAIFSMWQPLAAQIKLDRQHEKNSTNCLTNTCSLQISIEPQRYIDDKFANFQSGDLLNPECADPQNLVEGKTCFQSIEDGDYRTEAQYTVVQGEWMPSFLEIKHKKAKIIEVDKNLDVFDRSFGPCHAIADWGRLLKYEVSMNSFSTPSSSLNASSQVHTLIGLHHAHFERTLSFDTVIELNGECKRWRADEISAKIFFRTPEKKILRISSQIQKEATAGFVDEKFYFASDMILKNRNETRLIEKEDQCPSLEANDYHVSFFRTFQNQ